jgi:hypothetical protein
VVVLRTLGQSVISGVDLLWVAIVLMMGLRFSRLHVLHSKLVVLLPKRSFLHVGIIIFFLLVYFVIRQLFRRIVVIVSGITSVDDSV